MHVEFLIIGQGICGSFLSYELKNAGRTFLVIDDKKPFSSSRVASGIINPITGRRMVKTWMIDELMTFAKAAYAGLAMELGIDLVHEFKIIDFFPTLQMHDAFKKRYEEGAEYLALPEDNQWQESFNYFFGYGEIAPSYHIELSLLLAGIRDQFTNSHALLEETFNETALELHADGISYKDIHARKIIFCDGISSMDSRFFTYLPFAPNKGELLIAEIPGMPRNYIFKYGMTIIPWRDNLFWIGASHEWKFEHDQPTAAFLERTKEQLNRLIKLPFKILDHQAAVRPATLERRPFIGLHPVFPQVGIFNGMGTKGCSLAPYFATQFVAFLTNDKPLMPEVDIKRFSGILSKS